MANDSRSTELCLVNGEPSCQVSVADRGLNFADGLFETLRIAKSKAVLEEQHWRRLQAGLVRLNICCDLSLVSEAFQALLQQAAAVGKFDGVVKILVSRGEGGRGFSPKTASRPTVIVRWFDLPDYAEDMYSRGVGIGICKTRLPHRPLIAGLKHLGNIEYVMAAAEVPRESPIQQGLLLDPEDNLVESISANLFLLINGCLYTPNLKRCGVAGTMRQWILETILRQLSLPSVVEDLPLSRLGKATEVFICNSVFGVVAVNRIGDRSWPPGPVTSAIQAEVMKLFDA